MTECCLTLPTNRELLHPSITCFLQMYTLLYLFIQVQIECYYIHQSPVFFRCMPCFIFLSMFKSRAITGSPPSITCSSLLYSSSHNLLTFIQAQSSVRCLNFSCSKLDTKEGVEKRSLGKSWLTGVIDLEMEKKKN